MSYDHHSMRQNELLTHTLNNKEFMKATFEKSKQMNFTSTEGNLKSSLGSVKLEAHMDVNVSQSKKSNHPYQLNHTQTSRNEMHQSGNEMQIEDQEMSCLQTPALEPSFHGNLGVDPTEQSVISNFMNLEGLSSMRTNLVNDLKRDNVYMNQPEQLDSTDLRPSKIKQIQQNI